MAKALEYKGHPLQRKDNIIYYGSFADKYIIMMQILDSKKEGDLDMATKVEPNLRGWTFLTDYPRECASLAKMSGDHAERWELYHDGLELANAFTELCDAEEQRRRFEQARVERVASGEADYPVDEEFLDWLPMIGSASGVALGVDRLMMALGEENDIAEVRVLEFPPKK